MNNPKWGAKRQCQDCGARFYDLKRTKIVCPKCGAPFKMDAQPKTRAIATPEKAEAPAPVVEAVEKSNGTEDSAEEQALKEFDVDIPDDISPDPDEDDEEENVFEDVSKLGEDEDDVAEVIEGSRQINEG